MQSLKFLIQDLGADPYKILETDPNSDPSLLRKNYRNLAIKYHPDKNDDQSAKLMFLKVNQAYKYLEQEQNRKTYQQYVKALQEQKKRIQNMDEKRRKFAEDLKRRQQQHLKTKSDLQKQLRKSKEFFQKKMQQAQQRQNIKKQIVQSIGTQQYYQIISSFQVIWREGLSFTEQMLRNSFKNYGKIESIKMQAKRNRATIIFNSIQDCTKLVEQFRHSLITVKYQLQKSKRDHLLKALNKQKLQKIDFSLSSQNIERFKQIINRGSGIYKANNNTQF